VLIVAKQKLGSDGLWAEAGRIDREPRVQVEAEVAVRINVAVEERCDAAFLVG